jgi:hypothetical protein
MLATLNLNVKLLILSVLKWNEGEAIGRLTTNRLTLQSLVMAGVVLGLPDVLLWFFVESLLAAAGAEVIRLSLVF